MLGALLLLTGFVNKDAFTVSAAAEGPSAAAPKLDVLAMKVMPARRYETTLELKQLDGKSVTVELEVKGDELISPALDGRLGQVRGRMMFIGNGVFMVQLTGTGYRATQHWVFHPDGTASILEIPDRGEKQTAKPLPEK